MLGRVSIALDDPHLAWVYVASRRPLRQVSGITERDLQRHKRAHASAKSLSDALGLDERELRRFGRQFARNRAFLDHIDAQLGEGWLAQTVHPYELYLTVRVMRPEVFVETGVASGFSAAFILQALEDNGLGRLYSIDLPDTGMQFLPNGKAPGWVVPRRLQSRWTLILGKTSERLTPLLEQLHAVDVFMHDSEHTYGTMTYEYEAAWPHIKPGGFLLSDDVGMNDAFVDFCGREKRPPAVLNGRLGIVRK